MSNGDNNEEFQIRLAEIQTQAGAFYSLGTGLFSAGAGIAGAVISFNVGDNFENISQYIGLVVLMGFLMAVGITVIFLTQYVIKGRIELLRGKKVETAKPKPN